MSTSLHQPRAQALTSSPIAGTRHGSLWGHKWLRSLGLGMVLLLHLNACVGFFPSGYLFFSPEVLSLHLIDKI